MLIRLLGVVSAGADADSLVSPPGKVASGTLAHLALAGGQLVSASSLIDAVWDEPAPSARNAVQVAVSRLRAEYGSELITTNGAGYRLRTELVTIDWFEAEQLLADARRSVALGDTGASLAATESALRLFAGEPLAGLESSRSVAARQRAAVLREAVTTLRTESLLESGDASGAAACIRVVTDLDGLNEPAHALLMRALAAEGRQAEALAVYDGLRSRLEEELGLDPSAELVRAFTTVLAGGAAARDIGTPVGSPSKAAPTVTLPRPAGAFRGRDFELVALAALFDEGNHLVTLVGPGGIGKTRLAVEAARAEAVSASRSAAFVDLSVVRSAHEVVPALLRVLDVDDAALEEGLAASTPLLILDNAEHLLAPVAELVSRLLSVDGVDVLVTSRTPLRLVGERIFDTDGLAHGSIDSPAVKLIADRASLSEADVAAGAEDLVALASRLDGVPLAMELLAAALRWSTPREVLDGFSPAIVAEQDGARDRPSRHSSVSSAVDWSVQQATPDAVAALKALTIMRGSFDEDAASAVIATVTDLTPREVLAELLDLALVKRIREPDRIRFRLLEPIRLFASDPSRNELGTATAHAHSMYFLDELDRRHARIETSADPFDSFVRDDQTNLTAALEWAWANDREFALRRLGVLAYGWFRYNQFDDVQHWCRLALEEPAVQSDGDRMRIAIAWLCALIEMEPPDPERVHELSELVSTIQRAATDNALDDLWHERWVHSQVQRHRLDGDPTTALEWTSRHRKSTVRNRRTMALSRASIFATLDQWDDVAAEITGLMSLGEFPSEDDLSSDVILLASLGYVFVVQGELAKASEMLERGLALAVRADLPAERTAVGINLGWLMIERGDHVAAIDQVLSSVEDSRGLSNSLAVIECLTIAGLALAAIGRVPEAHILAGEVARRRPEAAGMIDSFLDRHIETLLTQAGEPSERTTAPIPLGDLIALVRDARRVPRS